MSSADAMEKDDINSEIGKIVAMEEDTPAVASEKEQQRAPEDSSNNSRNGMASDTSVGGERKHDETEREPNSPGQDGAAEDASPMDNTLTPNAKKERTSYYDDMDNDSPSSYPKHVIVPTSENRAEEKSTSAYNDDMYPPETEGDDDDVPGPEEEQHDVNPQPYEHPPPDFAPEKSMHQAPPPQNQYHLNASVLTPDSRNGPPPPPPSGHQAGSYEMYSGHHQYPDVYRAPSYQEMEYGRATYGGSGSTGGPPDAYGAPPSAHNSNDQVVRPRRWACDFCNVATFLSYEEACAHEEACARRQHDQRHGYHDGHQPPMPPQAAYGAPRGSAGGTSMPPPPQQQHHHGQGTGLGALYHASQEVVTPPTPHHRQQQGLWQPRGPPLPVLPHEQAYYRSTGSYYEDGYRAAPPPPEYSNFYQSAMPSAYGQPTSSAGGSPADYFQKRMLLAMRVDSDSLSDRQCYVRSEMVEIFAASDKDVAARHSKGAQKLVMGQVGIRCVHCSHVRARDRAERAVCYPSSISRIYQTVADMQRFHFEQCREIPDHVRQIYKKLKTTRPRGVGSPQSYWVQSAKSLGLVDTETGIRFDSDMSKQRAEQTAATHYPRHHYHMQAPPQQHPHQSSEMSISTL